MTELAETSSTFSFGGHCPSLGHCETLRRSATLAGSVGRPSAAELAAAVLLIGRKYADRAAFTIGVRHAEWAEAASLARISADMPAQLTLASHVRAVAANLADITPGPAVTDQPRLALLCVLDGAAGPGLTADLADLIVSAEADGDGVMLHVDHHSHAHDSAFADHMLGHLANLMGQFTDCPDRSLGSTSLLTAPEHEQLRMVNATRHPQASTIYQLFQAQVATRAQWPAISHEYGTVTYRQLAGQADALARALSALGIDRHSRVAFVLGKSPLLVVAMLAIIRLGAAYVPVEANLPASRRAKMLSDSDSKLLVTDVPDVVANVPVLFLGPDADVLSRPPRPAAPAGDTVEDRAGSTPTDIAYIMYTSGTTGAPKGVQVSHRAVVRLVYDTDYADLGPETRILQTGAIAFDAATFEIWGAILNGGTVALTPVETVLDARRLAAAIARHRVNTMWLTAGLFNQLVEQDPAVFNGCQVLTGGEAASARHFASAIAACPDSTFTNCYGPTENTTFSTAYRATDLSDDVDGTIPIGRPITNSTAYVLDSEGNPQPVGVPGELCVGGAGLSDGYLGRPNLNERVFVHAGPDAERLYRTGDIAYWTEEMTLRFVGRADDQVKIRGFRVELAEVENYLGRATGVAEAVALVRRDENGAAVLCAYYTADRQMAATDLRQALRRELPEYMVPTRFQQLEKIPLTSNHKVDREALVNLEPLEADRDPEPRKPRTPHEISAVKVFADLLGLPEVGLDDDFFALGGHSLLAMRLWSRIRETIDTRIGLDEVLAHPTAGAVAELAERVTAQDGESDRPAARLVRPKLMRRP
jgi:amino acid adenylation domain-containing protein